MSLWRNIASALIVSGMLAGLALPGHADEPLKLRVGWAVVPAQLTSVLWAKPELLKHYGKSYTVEAIHFRGSTPQITGLAAGELDLAALAFSSFALAIQNAHMQDIRAVSDLYQDAVSGYYSNQMMVRPDGEIKKVEDLKGKIVATNAIGGALDIAAQVYMSKRGLQPKRDYQIIEIEFPNMVSALRAEESRHDRDRHALLGRRPKKRHGEEPLRCRPGDGTDAADAVGGAGVVHRRASRRAGRFLRGCADYAALVSRPSQPRRRASRSSPSSRSSRNPILAIGCSRKTTTIGTPTRGRT